MDMKKLMKPAEYAQELGISRQAVYAKIKRGMLEAKNVEGKLYIVVDNTEVKETNKTVVPALRKVKAVNKVIKSEAKDYKSLLEAKDETISVLKGTVKDLKKSNKQISTTLKGEIDLLKEAFHEMRSLYVLQLEQKLPEEKNAESEEVIEVEEEASTMHWVGLKKFFKLYDISKAKQQEKIVKRLSKAFKNDDVRLANMNGKLKLNADAEYGDILR